MHNLILGQRNAGAMQSILTTSKLLAEHFKIDPALASALKVQEKDPLVRALKEREAVANLLEEIQMSLGLSAPVEPGAGVDVTPEAVIVETGEGLPAPVVEEEAQEANVEEVLPVNSKRVKKAHG